MIAAIYARKSTDQTGVADEQKSVTRQIEHARQYAERKGWTVADGHIYVDDGVSGAEFANRPGFFRLMNALKPKPAFQVLIMSEESRLGRESTETFPALKQLLVAGVRVFFYLDDRELQLGTFVDNTMTFLRAEFAAEERRKAAQRTRDAMLRKARAGHVTGGRAFGYRNVEIQDAAGQRSHVEREIVPVEADVVRDIFRLCTEGHGLRAIAKRLNDQGAVSPRAQQGRSQSWAQTSVREILHRRLYRGEIVWAQTAKRDRWGHKKQSAKPEADWIRVQAPALRIVTDAEWNAAHQRLSASRQNYLKSTSGAAFGRPPLGTPSKYLLTNLAVCGCCGAGLWARSRSHGTGRKFYYGCSAYHERGVTQCTNGADVPMEDANEILIEALLDDVLDGDMLREAVDEGLKVLLADGPGDELGRLDATLATLDQERGRLVTAIATGGGDLPGLLDALRTRDRRREEIEAARAAVRSQRRLRSSDMARVRDELMTLAGSWRQVLSDDPTNARPIVSGLLKGRVTYTPLSFRKWELRGESSLFGLFSRGLSCCDGVPKGNPAQLRA